MQDYYKNLTIDDVKASGILSEYQWARGYYNPGICDLYFIGQKKGGESIAPPSDYDEGERVL